MKKGKFRVSLNNKKLMPFKGNSDGQALPFLKKTQKQDAMFLLKHSRCDINTFTKQNKQKRGHLCKLKEKKRNTYNDEGCCSDFHLYIYKNIKNQQIAERMNQTSIKGAFIVKSLLLDATAQAQKYKQAPPFQLSQQIKQKKVNFTSSQTHRVFKQLKSNQNKNDRNDILHSNFPRDSQQQNVKTADSHQKYLNYKFFTQLKDTSSDFILQNQQKQQKQIILSTQKFIINLQRYLSKIVELRLDFGLQNDQLLFNQQRQVKYRLGNGNNSDLIRQIFKKRWWWSDSQPTQEYPNLIWTQTKNQQYYSPPKQLKRTSNTLATIDHCPKLKQIHNHLQRYELFTNKINMVSLLNQFCNYNNKQSPFPLTFHVMSFQSQQWQSFSKQCKGGDSCCGIVNNRRWLVKQIDRGINSIRIGASYDEVYSLVKQGFDQDRVYFIQEYISPFLFKKRKIDVRVYVLITKIGNCAMKGYIFEEGCIGFATQVYQKYKFNPYAHFTSDQMQIHHNQYGFIQEGNKISFEQFQNYLKEIGESTQFKEQVFPQLKNTVNMLLNAVFHQFAKQTKDGFELLQLNFMLDQNFKPWLIKILPNPCLQVTCPLLQRLIPKIIDCTFKLTVDLLFPPPRKWPNSKKHLLTSKSYQNGFQQILDSRKAIPFVSDIIMDTEWITQVKTFQNIFEDGPSMRTVKTLKTLKALVPSVTSNGFKFVS